MVVSFHRVVLAVICEVVGVIALTIVLSFTESVFGVSCFIGISDSYECRLGYLEIILIPLLLIGLPIFLYRLITHIPRRNK